MPFEDLFGNQRIKTILSQYLRNNVYPHSMIFSGPVSTSKRAFALAYAKALNCLEENHDFCDRCRHCVQINSNLFPDVIGLEPEGRFYKKEQKTDDR